MDPWQIAAGGLLGAYALYRAKVAGSENAHQKTAGPAGETVFVPAGLVPHLKDYPPGYWSIDLTGRTCLEAVGQYIKRDTRAPFVQAAIKPRAELRLVARSADDRPTREKVLTNEGWTMPYWLWAWRFIAKGGHPSSIPKIIDTTTPKRFFTTWFYETSFHRNVLNDPDENRPSYMMGTTVEQNMGADAQELRLSCFPFAAFRGPEHQLLWLRHAQVFLRASRDSAQPQHLQNLAHWSRVLHYEPAINMHLQRELTKMGPEYVEPSNEYWKGDPHICVPHRPGGMELFWRPESSPGAVYYRMVYTLAMVGTPGLEQNVNPPFPSTPQDRAPEYTLADKLAKAKPIFTAAAGMAKGGAAGFIGGGIAGVAQSMATRITAAGEMGLPWDESWAPVEVPIEQLGLKPFAQATKAYSQNFVTPETHVLKHALPHHLQIVGAAFPTKKSTLQTPVNQLERRNKEMGM